MKDVGFTRSSQFFFISITIIGKRIIMWMTVTKRSMISLSTVIVIRKLEWVNGIACSFVCVTVLLHTSLLFIATKWIIRNLSMYLQLKKTNLGNIITDIQMTHSQIFNLSHTCYNQNDSIALAAIQVLSWLII